MTKAPALHAEAPSCTTRERRPGAMARSDTDPATVDPEAGAHGPVVTRWEGTPLEERLTRVRHVPIPYSSQDLRARPGDVRRAPRGYRAARSWGGGAASTGPLPLGG